MATIGDIMMRMLLEGSEFQAEAKKQGAKAGEAAGKAASQSVGKSLKEGLGVGLGIGIFQGLTGAIGNIVGGIEGTIATALSKAGEVERFETQFETLLGSAAAAQDRIAELVEFAATTPFELPEVINASRTLQVFTKGVLATGEGLRMVGDIAAGTGQPINDVAMWIGRLYDAMQSGRPFGEATMRLQEMGALSGENRAMIERLAKSVKDGNMTMAEAWATTGGVFSQFAGLMDKQSKTIEGQFSNLADATGQAFAGVGEELLPIAKAVIPEIINMVKGLGLTIAAFIKDHALELKQVILDLTNAAFGFVSGLFGIQQAIAGTAAPVGEVASAGMKAGMSFGEWRKATGNLPPVIDSTTASTKAATTAIDRQVKSIDKAIDAEKRREDAALDAIDAQEKALDLAEEQIAVDERKRDLNDRLNEAQLALAKAQKPDATGKVDAEAVSEAMAKIAEIQQDQAENERRLGVDAQRDRLQQQRDEIQAKSQARQDELADVKAKLQEEKQVISAAASARKTDNAKLMGDLRVQYQTYLDGQETATQESVNFIGALVIGNASKGTGLGGSLTKAFADGKLAGESFRLFITDDLIPAVQGVLDVFMEIVQAIRDVGDSEVWKVLTTAPFADAPRGPERMADPKFGNKGARSELGNILREIWDRFIGNPATGNVFPVRAEGGPVMRGHPFIGNEGRRQEYFVPSENGTVIPSLGAMSRWMGGAQTITVPVYLDGRVIANVVAEHLADDYRS